MSATKFVEYMLSVPVVPCLQTCSEWLFLYVQDHCGTLPPSEREESEVEEFLLLLTG